jgi:hypothetical protein
MSGLCKPLTRRRDEFLLPGPGEHGEQHFGYLFPGDAGKCRLIALQYGLERLSFPPFRVLRR